MDDEADGYGKLSTNPQRSHGAGQPADPRPGDGPLFTRIRAGDDVTSQRLTPQAVYHILGQRRAESGIGECAPHDLRRTFASMMLDNGEDLITVRDAMGHASVTTTQKYDRRGDERLRKAADKLRF